MKTEIWLAGLTVSTSEENLATRYELKYMVLYKYNFRRFSRALFETCDFQKVISLSTHFYSVFQINSHLYDIKKIVKTMLGSWPTLHQTFFSNSQVYTRPNLHTSREKQKTWLFESISRIHLLTSHKPQIFLWTTCKHAKLLWIWG